MILECNVAVSWTKQRFRSGLGSFVLLVENHEKTSWTNREYYCNYDQEWGDTTTTKFWSERPVMVEQTLFISSMKVWDPRSYNAGSAQSLFGRGQFIKMRTDLKQWKYWSIIIGLSNRGYVTNAVSFQLTSFLTRVSHLPVDCSSENKEWTDMSR